MSVSDNRETPQSAQMDTNLSPSDSVESAAPMERSNSRNRRSGELPAFANKPSSNDACATIVMGLMMFNKQSNDEEFSRKACESLVKKMKDKREELDALITAVFSQGDNAKKCVTIGRTLDGRLQVAGRKGFPHVVYTKIFRWPDLHKNELKHAQGCENAFDLKGDSVCVNPYHYERIINPGLGHMDIKLETVNLEKANGGEGDRRSKMSSGHSAMISPTSVRPMFPAAPGHVEPFITPTVPFFDAASLPSQQPSASPTFATPELPSNTFNSMPSSSQFDLQHMQQQHNHSLQHTLSLFAPHEQISLTDPCHSPPTMGHNGAQLGQYRDNTHISPGFQQQDMSTLTPTGPEFTNQTHMLNLPPMQRLPAMPPTVPPAHGQTQITSNNYGGVVITAAPYSGIVNVRSFCGNSLCVTNFEPPDDSVDSNWACFVYYEHKQRIGERQVKSNLMYIDGGFGSSPNRFCLGLEVNPTRDDLTDKCRMGVGKGIRLSTKENGDVWCEVFAPYPCFVHSQFLDRESGRSGGDVVHKIYPGSKLKLYDLSLARQSLLQHWRATLLAKSYMAGVPTEMDDIFRAFERARIEKEASRGADELHRFCVARISFIKGWGPDYTNRPDITDCPCWIELKVNKAFTYLDQLLTEQNANHLPQP